MWSSSGPILSDKTDFNKADIKQYLFNENAVITVRKLLKTCRGQRWFYTIFSQNASISRTRRWVVGHLVTDHSIVRALQVKQYCNWPGARIMCFAARPAPRGAFRGCAPPNECFCPPKRKLCPPKRGLCPEEINKIGAAGVQIEAEIGVWHPHIRNFCGLAPDFTKFLGWRPFFFFSEVTFFRAEKPFEFLNSAEKSFWISVKTFFFWFHLVHLIQTWINFSCLRVPLKFTHINFSCPPKIYFCPPVTLSWCRACFAGHKNFWVDAYAAEIRRTRNAAAFWRMFYSKFFVILHWYRFFPQIWRRRPK